MREAYDVVILGLSLSSSWGNGHATTYRALVKGLGRRGRRVLFLERDQPWYAAHRDFTHHPHCRIEFYRGVDELAASHARAVQDARAVIVGSFVPDGITLAHWVLGEARGVRAFYDIDTPVTLASVTQGDCRYLDRALIPGFDLYLSFTGGPTLRRLESEFGARRAEALYCAVDLDQHRPTRGVHRVDLGYLGTWSADRQPRLERLLLEPARRLPSRQFQVAGAQYPASVEWPPNVRHEAHLPPHEHARFFGEQRFTLNLTRDDMIAAGFSPSVRLFEAGACGVPVISDIWRGIDTFFEPGREILLARDAADVCEMLDGIGEVDRRAIGAAARERVRAHHTAIRRAAELEQMLGLPALTTRRASAYVRPDPGPATPAVEP